MWAKVEHPFHVIKNLFRHRKTRYRGLAKNTAQLFTKMSSRRWCTSNLPYDPYVENSSNAFNAWVAYIMEGPPPM